MSDKDGGPAAFMDDLGIKFKCGDRVRILHGFYRGQIGTVIGNENVCVQVEERRFEGRNKYLVAYDGPPWGRGWFWEYWLDAMLEARK